MRKNVLSALGIVVCAMLFLVSCESGGGKVSSMQFKRMNIAGAKALALASDGSNQQNAPARMPAALMDEGDPEYNISNPIFTVSEDGTLVEVHYTIEVVGNGEIVDMIKANMRLKAQYIYEIGDEWLWLVNCEYDYPGIDEVKEPLRGQIRNLMHAGFESNFLVRKSDGALFEWTREQGRPERGRGYWRPSDVYGEVEIMGKDLFTCPSMGGLDDYYGRVYKLEDKGDYLNVVNMLNSTQQAECLLPDSRGIFGSIIYEQGAFIFPDKPGETQLVWSKTEEGKEPYGNIHLVSINNTLYAIGFKYTEDMYVTDAALLAIEHITDPQDMWIATDVLVNLGKTTAESLQQILWTPTAMWPFKKPYKTSVMTWWQGNAIYSVDPIAKTVAKRVLPAHYPGDENSYYDGIAYSVDDPQNPLPSSFYICDLSKDAAEEVTIDYSALAEYLMKIVPGKSGSISYDPNTQSFRSSLMLTDGTMLNIYIYVSGEYKGKALVFREGENTAGQVISVMVRLN